MKWIITGFIAMILFLERVAICNKLKGLVNIMIEKEIKKPLVDGYESVKEILDWIGSKQEVSDRVKAIKEYREKSKAFARFLLEYGRQKEGAFSEVAALIDKYNPSKKSRWLLEPCSVVWAELASYDNSNAQMAIEVKRLRLLKMLEETNPDDAEIMFSLINGSYTLPDRVNHKILALALGELEGE